MRDLEYYELRLEQEIETNRALKEQLEIVKRERDNLKGKALSPFKRATTLQIQYTFGPWYKRLIRSLLRKKPGTAGKGDYLIEVPPKNPPPDAQWGMSEEEA